MRLRNKFDLSAEYYYLIDDIYLTESDFFLNFNYDEFPYVKYISRLWKIYLKKHYIYIREK